MEYKLKICMKKNSFKKPATNSTDLTNNNTIPVELQNSGLPANLLYPPSEDLYNMGIESSLNPENILEKKQKNERTGKNNEKNFDEDLSGADLDVPGAELDDKEECIGSEDEENNYYSLGGDEHNDLDEDKGD
jgi:hypothetical protein